ncbi:hypothetical protein PBI_MORRISSEY_51 [Gordonia phage Morrissey]|nr:hypothetical protein PBI_MORRISSEY_51 [Gordonia phage Morrissey]
MSNTIVTIHYQSPAEDPLKVPRPTRIQFDDAGNVKTTGGEGEISGDQLIGLSRQDGPPESFDAENWVEAEELISEGVADLELAGWFPVFMCGEGIYTWSGAVDRVEVTVQC